MRISCKKSPDRSVTRAELDARWRRQREEDDRRMREQWEHERREAEALELARQLLMDRDSYFR